MKFRFLPFLLLVLAPVFALGTVPEKLLPATEQPAVSGLRVANNYDFPVREKIAFRLTPELAAQDGNLLAVSHSVVGGTVEAHYLPVQVVPDESGENSLAWIDVQLRPAESRRYTFQNLGGGGKSDAKPEFAAHHASGLPHRVSLPSGIAVELFDLSLLEVFDKLDRLSTHAIPGKFQLVRESHGPVLSTLVYRGNFDGENSYRAEIRYRLLSSGVCDIEIDFQASEVNRQNGYVALAKSISASENQNAFVRQRGNVQPLQAASASTKTDDSGNDIRWLALQNGTDENLQVILADFTPKNGTFINERVTAGQNQWFMLSEIARANPDSGSTDNKFLFPKTGETISLRFRVLPSREQTLEAVDQTFAAFSGYRGRSQVKEDLQVDFGVGAVSFGATYSQLENRPQIERDFRIANAIGLEWIRIEGIDSLTNLESLAFLAESAQHSGLKLLLNFSLKPADARTIAERLGQAIGLYEIDTANSASQLAEAEKVRQAILAVQPNATVFLKSSPQIANPGFDSKVVAKIFPASLTSDPAQVRDVALALGGFASLQGKSPVISKYIWTADASQNENELANQFFHNHQNLLQQHGAGIVFLSEFSETAEQPSSAPALIRPDGTPKQRAQALYELIERHGAADSTNKLVEVKMPLLRISPERTVSLPVTITNKGNQPLEIRTRPLLPDGLTTDSGEESFTLRPRQSRTIQRPISAGTDLAPGVYHIFEEIRFQDAVRIGWSYAKYQ